MNILLNGKKALVGGATSGIGRAIAEQLAKSGASVTLMARNKDKLIRLAQNLPSEHGQNHDYLVVDFSNFEAYQERITEFFGKNNIDILINNTQLYGSVFASSLLVSCSSVRFRIAIETLGVGTRIAFPVSLPSNFG